MADEVAVAVLTGVFVDVGVLVGVEVLEVGLWVAVKVKELVAVEEAVEVGTKVEVLVAVKEGVEVTTRVEVPVAVEEGVEALVAV